MSLDTELLAWEVEIAFGWHELIVLSELQVWFLHQKVESSMSNWEKTAFFGSFLNFICDQSCNSSQISGSSISTRISNDAISCFKKFVRKWVRFVLTDSFEKSRKKRSSTRLKFFRFCITDRNQLGFILIEDICSHICLWAECKIENLVKLSLCHLLSEEICEFVQSDPVSNSRAGR